MTTQHLIFAVAYFAFGAGLIFLAVLIVRDTARIRLNRVTSMMLFLAGLGPVFIALGQVISPYQAASPLKESFLYNLVYVWELFFPALVYFSWVFPIDRLAARRSRWRWLVFLPHIFHIVLVIFFADTDRVLNLITVDPGKTGLLATIQESISSIMKWLMIPLSLLLASHKKFFALVNLAYVVLALSYLFKGLGHVETPRLRRQVRVIITGILAAMTIYIFTFIMPNLISLEISPMTASLLTIVSLVVGAGSIAWAIVRYQFLDIRLIIRQSVVYTASSALLVGLYVLGITKLSALVASVVGEPVPLLNAAFIVAALILFQPINNQIDNIIKRVFLRDRSDYRNIINRLSSQIIHILDRRQLFALVEETLRSHLLVEGVGFSLYDDERRSYLYFSHSNGEEVRLSQTDPMLGAIGQLKTPTFYDRIQAWHRGSTLATMLQGGGVHLIVPLNDREHLLGFVTLTDKSSGYKFSFEDITLLSTLSNQMVVALTNVRLYRESLVKQRLEEEMNLARQIQVRLLPESPPCGKGFALIAHNQPSRTVGGDFYDFVRTNDNGGFAIIVADVSGKGMPAALLAAQLQAALRAEVSNRRRVAETISNVNNIIADLASKSHLYATMVYGQYQPDTNEFEYSNAGHNHPVLVRADGSHEFLEAGGTIIGAFEGVPYDACKIKLQPSDILFFYTDGLSEALNSKDEEFGQERIVEFLHKNRHLPPDQIKDAIIRQVHSFSGVESPEDDTTIVILKASEFAHDR